MKHFIEYVEAAIKENWTKPSISNYGAKTYNFSGIAEGICKWHILFDKYGIKKGDHIAICSFSALLLKNFPIFNSILPLCGIYIVFVLIN